MSNQTPDQPYSEDELHALVDGQLTSERAAQIESHLKTDAQAAAQVAAWRTQNAAILSAFADQEVGGPSQASLVPHKTHRPRAWLAVAAAVLVSMGGAVGYLAGVGTYGNGDASAVDGGWLASDASAVHLTYVREVRRPVEVPAEEHDHLVTWLGNRIERNFTAPALDDLGFSLLGGRLVPVGGLPGAMLMYESAGGDRATIILARNIGARDTAFQFSQTQGVNTLRWIDGANAYAISGFMERENLEAISAAVYAHFEGYHHPG